jgi:hypothetical protein
MLKQCRVAGLESLYRESLCFCSQEKRMGIDFVFDSHGNMWTIEEWTSVCPLTWNSERVLTEDDVKNFYDPSGYNE